MFILAISVPFFWALRSIERIHNYKHNTQLKQPFKNTLMQLNIKELGYAGQLYRIQELEQMKTNNL